MTQTPTYHAEADHLLASYHRAVGEALSLGIKVYEPGGQPKALGDLRDEIRAVTSYVPRHRA